MGFGEKRQNTVIHDVRYDHEHGRFTISDRVLNCGRWENTEPQDITGGFRAIFDLPNAELAWFRFIKGEKTRAIHPVKACEKLRSRPDKDCRKHVRVLIRLDNKIDTNERIRVLMTMSAAMWDGLEGVHTAYQNNAAAHPGKLPIVECVGVVPVREGTSMQPQFSIVEWVDRPDSLPDVLPYTVLDDDTDAEAAEARASANGRGRRTDDRDYYDQEIPF
jgi:hypothetical protein